MHDGASTEAAREHALATAAEMRSIRDQVEGALVSGALELGTVFTRAEAEPMVGYIRTLSILESVPGVGKVGARRILSATEIDGATPVGSLTGPERSRLAAAIAP